MPLSKEVTLARLSDQSRGRLGSRFPLYPMNDGDFRTTVPAEWEEGPAEATIHIEPMASTFMSSRDATTTAGREPECRHPWNLPLPSVTVPAQYQVDGMRLIHHVEDVGGVCEEERVAAVDYLRRQSHGSTARLQRVARVIQRSSR